MDRIDCLLINVPYPSPKRVMEMWHRRIEHFTTRMETILRNRYLYGESTWPSQKTVQICYEGLLCIGEFLSGHGLRVEFFYPEIAESDMTEHFGQFLETLRDYFTHHEVSIAALGPVTSNYLVAQIISREIKKVSPNTCVVIGGHHATFLSDYILRESPSIDVVVRYEGETQMHALCEGKPLSEIRGISYREGSRIHHNPDAPLLKGEDVPPQALSLLPQWVFERDILLNLGTGRGCPFRCFFCTDKVFWRGKTRFKSLEKVVEELTTTIGKFGIKKVRFTDDTFTLKPDFISELGKRLKEEKAIFEGIQAWTRIDTISDETINALKSIGEKVEVCIGVESGSPSVLHKMNKQITAPQILDGFKKIKEHKILSHSFWIVGHPGSSPEKEAESLSLLDRLLSDDLCSVCETSVFQPYPGSEAFYYPENHGVVIDSFHWSCYKENPPFFPPVSHLETLSPIEITQWYTTFRLHIMGGLVKNLGLTYAELNEL